MTPDPQLRAVEQLFAGHSKVLGGFLRQRASHLGLDADDISQELFARLMDNRELVAKLRSGELNVRPYLISMANNLMMDLARSKNRRQHLSEALQHTLDDSHYSPGPEHSAIAQQEMAALKRTIMSLKPTWRQAFVLNRFGNLTYREIAIHMGVSTKQVENYMSRALVRIRKTQIAIDREQI